MTPSCQDVRDSLLECRGSVLIADADRLAHVDLLAHLGKCAECASFARRTARISASLSQMIRLETPRELDGLAVAVLQAGCRQDRAVAALRGLARLRVPSELPEFHELTELSENPDGPDGPDGIGRALEEPTGDARAPAVLDRLVEEDLRDSTAALARRLAGKLEHRRAPEALRERLGRSALSALRPPATRRNLLAAATLVLLLAVGGMWLHHLVAPAEVPDLGFQVRYESDLDAMDPMARSLLAGLSGGIVDLGPRGERK